MSQPKSNNSSQKPELVAYQPVEQPSVTLRAEPTPSDESPSVEQQGQTVPPFASKRNLSEKPQHLEKGKAKRISPDKKKSNSLQQPQFTLPDDDEELPPERYQHIQFMDCDKQVGRVILECWHSHQGIISEYTGEPVMGEYKGRPSLTQVKIQCPNCKQTAIRLTMGQVLSTTAIPSPWQQ